MAASDPVHPKILITTAMNINSGAGYAQTAKIGALLGLLSFTLLSQFAIINIEKVQYTYFLFREQSSCSKSLLKIPYNGFLVCC